MTEELKELEGDKIPVWLEDQMKQAKTTPVATPSEMPDPLLDAGSEETYKGAVAEQKEKYSKKKKKTRKIKDQDTTSEPQNPNGFFDIASELAEMLTEKNRKYGDSYARMAHVLPIFYPDGVPGDHLLDAVFILRIVDKLMRIASAQKDDDEDPVMDVAGYAILRMREMRRAE